MRQDGSRIHRDQKFNGMDVQNMWNAFIDMYEEKVEKYVPQKERKLHVRSKWMTKDLKRLIQKIEKHGRHIRWARLSIKHR